MFQDVQMLIDIIMALQPADFGLAFLLFLVISIGSTFGWVRGDGWSAGVLSVLAVVANGGWANFNEFATMLETSAVVTLATVYYLIYKSYLATYVNQVKQWFREKTGLALRP